MKINKKIFTVISILLAIIIISIIFIIMYYKFFKSGNTIISKSEEDIINKILNISSYNATIQIQVQTNKNKTQYIVKQSLKGNISKQEVIQPENIAGVITEYDGSNLKISNNKLQLTTTYANYPYIVENNLWLDSFIKEYKQLENSKATSSQNEIILELKNEDGNKYSIYKKLYIDLKTQKPTKMIIQDINQNTLLYILYTEIEIS